MQIQGKYEHNKHCRNCGSSELIDVLDLGDMPLANSLLSQDGVSGDEPFYPLKLLLCKSCSLAQLSASVDPSEMFDSYLYFSSYSQTMLDHVRKSANRLVRERELNEGSLVVEIASNDGYMLQYFRDAGVPVLGVEPAANVAMVAEERGIPSIVEYFGKEVAEKMAADGQMADVILANNVLAHVPNLHSFVEGIRIIMKEDGIGVIETPYVKTLIDDCKFDTIYHEHLFYYSLTALDSLFRQHSMHLVDVEQVSIHGGSLRIFVQHQATGEASERVIRMLRDEERWVKNVDVYNQFTQNTERILSISRDVLTGLKAAGKTVGAYGAAAKGTVFLNAAHIGTDLVDFVVDRSPYKQNLYMPGVHIPIYSPDHVMEAMPDYLLILVWNFGEEIMNQMSDYEDQGGRFITAIPDFTIKSIRR